MQLQGFALIFLITIFCTSGISKLLSLRKFQETLNALELKKYLQALTKFMIPVSEILASIALLFTSTRIWGCILLMLLLISFLYPVLKAMKLKVNIACNCFGNITNEYFGKITLFRIIFLMIVTIYVSINSPAIKLNVTVFELTTSVLTTLIILFTYSVLLVLIDYNKLVSTKGGNQP